jgi:hypothetical protein
VLFHACYLPMVKRGEKGHWLRICDAGINQVLPFMRSAG